MRKFLFSLFLLFPSFILPLQAQVDLIAPKWEVRAVWLTTAGGADWPKTYDVEAQKRSLVEIFDVLQKKHFNTVFFQVRPRGNTFYKSRYEPWAAELTGTLGQDPGWDPLDFAINEAHKRGMELHAWFNVAKVYNGGEPPLSSPRHILRSHPEWAQLYDGEWWVDMGRPEVRAYTENLIMELVRLYDLDGIHLDYIRYPGEKFDDWNSFRLYSDGVERDKWRRNNITTFVREVYEQIMAEKPMMKVGSAPLGIYKPIPGAQSGFSAYAELFQDARLWLREKIQDYVAPQLYWDFGEQTNPNDPDFRALCIDWAQNSYGRHVYAGLGVYRENIQKEITEQVFLTRTVGCQGQSFFRYENILDLPGIAVTYKYPALIPPMPWKDSIPPLPPSDITVFNGADHSTLVRWKEPAAAIDGDEAAQYVLYRSTDKDVDINNPRNILAVIPAPDTMYVDDPPNNNIQYYYTVTALDKGNNESAEMTSALIASPDNSPLPGNYSLAQNYPNPFSDRTYISYELSKRSPVELTVRDSTIDRDIVIVKEIQDAGTYIVAIDAKLLAKGKHRYQLKAGAFVATKYLERGE
ncbi:MAG TPA: family 10 glycosylhydrolase [Bacteroidota bacterium]|nr:family 10 glycosylhydrolase [Bacteroidota bacterium]